MTLRARGVAGRNPAGEAMIFPREQANLKLSDDRADAAVGRSIVDQRDRRAFDIARLRLGLQAPSCLRCSSSMTSAAINVPMQRLRSRKLAAQPQTHRKRVLFASGAAACKTP